MTGTMEKKTSQMWLSLIDVTGAYWPACYSTCVRVTEVTTPGVTGVKVPDVQEPGITREFNSDSGSERLAPRLVSSAYCTLRTLCEYTSTSIRDQYHVLCLCAACAILIKHVSISTAQTQC